MCVPLTLYYNSERKEHIAGDRRKEKMTMASQLQNSVIEAIRKTRENVTFTVSDNGPITHNYSNVREPKLQAGTVYVDAPLFPTITIGPKGGVTVWIRSYPEGDGKTALDAAIIADVLLAKQTARDNGKKIGAVNAAVLAAADPFRDVPANVNSAKPVDGKKK